MFFCLFCFESSARIHVNIHNEFGVLQKYRFEQTFCLFLVYLTRRTQHPYWFCMRQWKTQVDKNCVPSPFLQTRTRCWNAFVQSGTEGFIFNMFDLDVWQKLVTEVNLFEYTRLPATCRGFGVILATWYTDKFYETRKHCLPNEAWSNSELQLYVIIIFSVVSKVSKDHFSRLNWNNTPLDQRLYLKDGRNHCDTTHWFRSADCDALLAFWPPLSFFLFLNAEVTIFGSKAGVLSYQLTLASFVVKLHS